MTGGPKHVTLNALFFEPDRSAGPETYLRGLVPALAREYPRLRMTLVTTRLGATRLDADGWRDVCEIVQMPADEGQRLRRLGVEQIGLPRVARRRDSDLIHSLASVAPVRPGRTAVITLHDVTFFHEPTFNAVTTFGMRQIVGRAARGAAMLITGAEAARQDICATLGIDPERVRVVPHGAGQEPTADPAPADELARRLDLPRGARVILCVAAVRPHKNQVALVQALPWLPEDTVLVLVGHREPYEAQVRSAAARLQVEHRLRIPGYVDAVTLEGLWRLASCAVFPTRAEGFGLPIVEAMRRGVPVACSDIAVFHEVGGEVPRYFDSADPVSVADAVGESLSAAVDTAASRAQAGRFDWASAARGTYDAYQRALRA